MKDYVVYKDITLSVRVQAESENEAVAKSEQKDKYDWSELNEDVWAEED